MDGPSQVATQNQPKNSKSIKAIAYSFQGPLPHPDILAKYENIAPGSAEKIISMAQSQTLHRQQLEKDVIRANIANEKNGMNYAFYLTLVLMLIGAFLIYSNKSIAGYFSLFAPVIFQAGSFVYKKRTAKKELQEQDKEGGKPQEP